MFRLVRANTPKLRKATEKVLRRFYQLSPDGWRNKRCEIEIAKYQEKSEKARKSAMDRWQAEQFKLAQTSAVNDIRTHSEGNAPKPTPIPTPSSVAAARANLDQFEAELRRLDCIKSTPSKTPQPCIPCGNWRRRATPSINSSQPSAKSWQLLAKIVEEDHLSQPQRTNGHGAHMISPIDWEHRMDLARRYAHWQESWGPPPFKAGCPVPLNCSLRPTITPGRCGIHASRTKINNQ